LPKTRLLKSLLGVSLLYPFLILMVNLINLFLPRQSGLLALSEVFSPFLFIPLLFLVPLLFIRGFAFLRIALACCALVWVFRFMPPLNFFPAQQVSAAVELDVTTWNIYGKNPELATVIEELQKRPSSVVVLQETEGEWLASDSTLKKIYPYQLRYMQGAPAGLVLLSAYPIINYSQWDSKGRGWDPTAVLWAEIEVAPGRSAIVATAHPNSPDTDKCARPLCFDPTSRNNQINQIFSQVDQLLARKKPLILAGDFNTTQWEPTYQVLTENLNDTYLKAGLGWGATWRPFALADHKYPLLRIDYILASPDITPLKVNVDCTPRGSDHCIVTGRFGVS
jgi:vancomycin resistance protein VanJ